MTLRQYLDKRKMSFRKFSALVDIDAAQLNRYVNTINRPSIETAYKIYLATGRKVNLKDWFEEDKK